jgi:hypothetical protein
MISVFAVAFHMLVFFTLRLGAFYPFILCYTLIINKLNGNRKKEDENKIYVLITSTLFLIFITNKLNPNFVFNHFNIPVYIYSEYAFNVIALALFTKETVVYYKLRKYNNNISEEYE